MSNPAERIPSPKAHTTGHVVPSLDDEIDLLLETLPEEIRTQWEASNAAKSDSEQLISLRKLHEERVKILTTNDSLSMRERPHHVRVEQVYPDAIVARITEVEREAHTLLGAGKAARVVASIDNPEVCYKIMLPLGKVPPGTNSVAVEADLQDEISALGEFNGVRVPTVYTYLEQENTRAIVMERLDAPSLRDIFDEKEEWPASFEANTFFGALKGFLEAMHGHGYHHRDLHEGNVLVDRETGLPRVIDFGYGTRVYGDDDPYRKEYVETGHSKQLVLMSDMGGLQSLKIAVHKARLKRGT